MSNENVAPELKYTVSIKYTLDLKDFAWIKEYKISQ